MNTGKSLLGPLLSVTLVGGALARETPRVDTLPAWRVSSHLDHGRGSLGFAKAPSVTDRGMGGSRDVEVPATDDRSPTQQDNSHLLEPGVTLH